MGRKLYHLPFMALVFLVFVSCSSKDITKTSTVTELLDEAQTSVKMAFEAGCEIKAPYECFKAKAFYEIAKYETSKLNLTAGKRASLKAIEWALKAISVSYAKGE